MVQSKISYFSRALPCQIPGLTPPQNPVYENPVSAILPLKSVSLIASVLFQLLERTHTPLPAACYHPVYNSQEADEFKFTTNIIRWRHKRDILGRVEGGERGLPQRETNTRLVKWSDGSMQLLVGDEAFDVGEHSIDRRATSVLCDFFYFLRFVRAESSFVSW